MATPVERPLAPHGSTASELKERLEAERLGLPFLVYRDGSGSQRLFALSEDRPRVTIGRGSATDLALEWDAEVSRLHAAIELLGGAWIVSDDQLSTNGTYCNGAPLTGRHRLRDYDAIRVGKTEVVFRAPRGESRSETLPGGEVAPPPALTESQQRVLHALCRPLANAERFARPATNREIADELVLSVAAVKSHLRSLFGKFGVEDLPHNEKRSRLVERAFSAGAVSERVLGR